MATVEFTKLLSNGIFLAMIGLIPLIGQYRRVPVYDTFIDGAKEGVGLVIRLVPYVVSMIVAIGMLRASGFFTSLSHLLAPLLIKIGMPADVLPLALIRPFSGPAANAVLVDVIQQHGADSFMAQMAGCMVGSTETTFYVLAVYFGIVNIRRTRHALPAGLVADVVGIMSALWICHWLL